MAVYEHGQASSLQKEFVQLVTRTSKATTTKAEIDVISVSRGEVTYRLVGETPLIMNRLSEKAKRELLLPRGRLNQVERQTNLKHQPTDEYRAAAYTISDPDAPTFLALPAVAYKDCLRTAALDLAGTSKSQIGRLSYVVGDLVPVYGLPELMLSIVRMADPGRTPDVRSRPILRRWCCEIVIRYTEPLLTPQAVSRLLVAAGMTLGLGDWRQEKGSGNYGLFRIAAFDDEEYAEIAASGGRAAQVEAMRTPSCYDDESAELLSWFDEELARRQTKGSISVYVGVDADKANGHVEETETQLVEVS